MYNVCKLVSEQYDSMNLSVLQVFTTFLFKIVSKHNIHYIGWHRQAHRQAQRSFAVKLFYKNGDSVTTSQRKFRHHYYFGGL